MMNIIVSIMRTVHFIRVTVNKGAYQHRRTYITLELLSSRTNKPGGGAVGLVI